jgi:2-phosphoglycolate phosphatase
VDKREVDLIMFDLDGTLADTGHDLANAVNYARAHFNLSPLPDDLVYAHVGRGVEYLLRHALPEESPSHFEEVMRVFLERYEHHLLDKTVLYPNVHDVLDYFRNKTRVVVTNKMYRLSVAVLRGLGIERQFDAILGGDSGPDKKPDPALLKVALQRFDVDCAKAVMVGDGDTDVEAGKRAGVITCGVTYGLGDKKALLEARPDFLIDEFAQLPQYFC